MQRLSELRNLVMEQRNLLSANKEAIKTMNLYFDAFLENSEAKINQAFNLEQEQLIKVNASLPFEEVRAMMDSGEEVDFLYRVVPYRMLIFACLANHIGLKYDRSYFEEYSFLTFPFGDKVDFLFHYPFFDSE